MKKNWNYCIGFAVLAIFVLASCAPRTTEQADSQPEVIASVDTISAASGALHYEAGSYDAAQLKVAMTKYPYPGSVTIATSNEDGSPNLIVAIPGLSEDGQYMTFGLADNRTKVNMVEQGMAVVAIYEYQPFAEDKLDRNRGCRVILEYPGDEANATLNAGKERQSLYMKIVKILPLG